METLPKQLIDNGNFADFLCNFQKILSQLWTADESVALRQVFGQSQTC